MVIRHYPLVISSHITTDNITERKNHYYSDVATRRRACGPVWSKKNSPTAQHFIFYRDKKIHSKLLTMLLLLLLNLLFIPSILCEGSAYFFTVDAYTEECFFEKAEKDTKMGLTFEIAEGGFLDIDVTITGPDGKVIYQGEREGSGQYTFAAYAPGQYTYCFNNKKGTMIPKVVMFNMEVSQPLKTDEEHPAGAEGEDNEAADHRKLDEMINELNAGLRTVKNAQEYMTVRNRIHREINESTNFRVVMWSFFEATVLVSMTLGQIFYLKRFFEIRRVV